MGRFRHAIAINETTVIAYTAMADTAMADTAMAYIATNEAPLDQS